MNGRKQKALAALIRAPTRAAAAKDAGVGVSTLRQWMREDAEFKAAYREALDELLQDATARSKRDLQQALGVLEDVMRSGENSQVRISAARTALEYSLKLTEAVDLSARMDKLEEILSEVEQ